ncbi:MAG: radical SAM protein [bacterium]|nr:radical SAM protein [bacterium]
MNEKKFQINLGNVCNNICKFCMNAEPLETRKFIPFSQIKKEIKEYRKKGYNVIGFLGGELTVYPKIIDLVRLATRLGYKRIDLVSNGRKYSDLTFLKELNEAGYIRFYLSIHSHEERTEDFLTSVKGSFREKIRGLNHLVSLKKKGLIREKIFINLVINKLNYKSLPRIILFYLRNFGVRDFRFNFIRPEGRAFAHFKILVPAYREVLPYVKRSVLLSEKLRLNLSVEGIPYCILRNMRNFQEYIGELKDGAGTIKEGIDRRKEFNIADLRKAELRVKPETCRECIYDLYCEGPWKDYTQINGFREFKPIRLKREKDPSGRRIKKHEKV